ncbi:uncharacterized protein LOC111436304 [Cucurbita moschata]|uniref:Uncharacterized protein LOC111436304 n=1 Tax=Cucurbita moschata TaxID=3662 RepID=A0A6J1ET95_CUCMO|nr:uncharacterized protein LOC111436304 [Cucurbita moschata]
MRICTTANQLPWTHNRSRQGSMEVEKVNSSRTHNRSRQGSMEVEKVNSSRVEDPSSVTEVRSFLGLANYYWRFVEGFSKSAKPLTELLKKGSKWSWTSLCQEAFDKLKNAMMEGQFYGFSM